MKAMVAAAGFLLVITGCAGGSTSSTPAGDTESSTPAGDTETYEPSAAASADPTDAYVAPDPDGTYTESCAYLLGDFTESKTGFRFVADARLRNSGNIGTVTRVRARWFLAGGDKITEQKRVRIHPGKAKRVGFVHVATEDEIELHQALGYSGKTCTVKVTIIDTFGKVQR